eukprot:756582-Hanusia_phi.AAC.2
MSNEDEESGKLEEAQVVPFAGKVSPGREEEVALPRSAAAPSSLADSVLQELEGVPAGGERLLQRCHAQNEEEEEATGKVAVERMVEDERCVAGKMRAGAEPSGTVLTDFAPQLRQAADRVSLARALTCSMVSECCC